MCPSVTISRVVVGVGVVKRAEFGAWQIKSETWQARKMCSYHEHLVTSVGQE